MNVVGYFACFILVHGLFGAAIGYGGWLLAARARGQKREHVRQFVMAEPQLLRGSLSGPRGGHVTVLSGETAWSLPGRKASL